MSRRAADWTVALAAAALALAACANERPRPVEPTAVETQAARVSTAPAPSVERAPACGPHTLPPDLLYAADGLCVRVVAYGQGELRSITFARAGDLLTVNSSGEIRRFRDVDHDGVFSPGPPETVAWAKTGATGGQECRMGDDALYCRTPGSVRRWRYDPAIAGGGTGELVVTGIPDSDPGARRPLAVWDGRLYVSNSVIKSFELAKLVPGSPTAWKDGDRVEQGTRLPVAIGHGRRRMVALDDEGVRALASDDTVVRLPRGSAASAMAFPQPGAPFALPAKWSEGGFVARRGSHPGDQSTGHDVVWGSLTSPAEVVFGAGSDGTYRGGDWSWTLGDARDASVSPTGLAISPQDGALYVTSAGGAIYRVALRGR